MSETLGYHLVKSTYGTWLPGDTRGHWSTAWDDQIGYYEPRHLHDGDQARERMAKERMKHLPTRLTPPMMEAVASAIEQCVLDSDWQVAAATIEPTHIHLMLTYSPREVDNTAKWIAQKTTKSVHKRTSFSGPVWCEGKWLEFIFEQDHWENLRGYIERHNIRRGLPAKPYPWIT